MVIATVIILLVIKMILFRREWQKSCMQRRVGWDNKVVKSFTPSRVTFKDQKNNEITDKLIREVKAANPGFQSGMIKGLSPVA